MDNYELLKSSIELMLYLEYFGIHIEDTKDVNYKKVVYFSVPELSTITTKDDKTNQKISNANGLIEFAKEYLTAIFIETCEDELSDKEKYILANIKENISDYLEFYAKIRTGETWNEEKGNNAMRKFSDNCYKKV